MSLVNDMLNDLDDRRLERVGEDVNLDWMSGQKSSRKKTPVLPILFAVGIAALVFIAYELWQLNSNEQLSPLDYLAKPEANETKTENSEIQSIQEEGLVVDDISTSVQVEPQVANFKTENTKTLNVLANSENKESSFADTNADVTKMPVDLVVIDTVSIDEKSNAISEVKELPRENSRNQELALKNQAVSNVTVEDTRVKKQQDIKSTGSLTAEQKDLQASRSADELIRAGRINDAEGQLLRFVNQNPSAVKSGDKLISLLLSTKKFTQADQMITRLRDIHPDHVGLIASQARLYLLTNRVSESVDLLMDHKPSLKNYPDYYELLGLASRQSNQYKLSVQTYRGLLEFDADRGDWWVGMAIALDLQGEYKQARTAYRQGINSRGLTMPLRDYAQQRLSVL